MNQSPLRIHIFSLANSNDDIFKTGVALEIHLKSIHYPILENINITVNSCYGMTSVVFLSILILKNDYRNFLHAKS